MCTIKVRHILTACVALYATAPAIHAQPAAGNAVPPPPRMEKLEEGEAPASAIPRQDDERARVTEKRMRGGRVTEVEVNSGRSTYILKPNTQYGSTVPGDTQSNVNRAPQWQIFGFDLKRPEDKNQSPQPDVGLPPPEAPAGK